MASQEHLAILKQGADIWNRWRKEHPNIRPDFSDVKNLRGINFSGADLRESTFNGVDVAHVNFTHANLSGANLYNVFFAEAKLDYANLSKANLSSSDFGWASLRNANLSNADLSYTSFIGSDLTEAGFTKASLHYTRFSETNLYGASFDSVRMTQALFQDVDLSMVRELETVIHEGPSSIGIDTVYRSKGNIPVAFLKGAGIPDTFITYIRSLVGKPIDYYSCFISYSSRDQEFAERLYADLQSKGIRCWYAPEDLKIGDEFRNRIDESIRLYDKLMVILSQHSIDSSWVEFEVNKALKKEQEQGKLALFPLKLDETIMETPEAWAAAIRKHRHIGDFTRWKEHDAYKIAFARLLHDLKA